MYSVSNLVFLINVEPSEGLEEQVTKVYEKIDCLDKKIMDCESDRMVMFPQARARGITVINCM